MTSPPTVLLTNAEIVTPDRVVSGALRLADGKITAVDTDPNAPADVRIDAAGQTVIPGLVDLHGDDIEEYVLPREGARIDERTALVGTDRANVSTGVTTKFHAIPFEDSPDEGRSVELAASLSRTIDAADDLVADHRLHARCEVTQPAAVDAVETALSDLSVDIVSITSDLPGKGQFTTTESFVDWYGANDGNKRESDLSPAEARSLVANRPEVVDGSLAERVGLLAERVREAGAVLASHDDESRTELDGLDREGVRISEYPTTLEAVGHAHELGMTTVMGAPNLIRGGSLFNNLDSRTAINAGVLDALCADYYPPALLEAPFVETGEPLTERVARVTRNPADAVGLTDRGRIEPGARADVLVVDPEPTPSVSYAFVRGHTVVRAGDVR